jgi:hypothetical protein
MHSILDRAIKPDPAGIVPIHTLVRAVRAVLPASAAPKRDELIAALSDAGYKLSFVSGQLHAAGCKLI